MLTDILNGILRLRHFPKALKTARVIVIPKPGNPLEHPESYRPISLLSTISKLFEKLFCKRLQSLLGELQVIPNHQFGFRSKRATLEQVHRVASEARNALEPKQYCCAIFLDISQAFDRVWFEGLIHKISQYLPSQYTDILVSYFHHRLFQVHF